MTETNTTTAPADPAQLIRRFSADHDERLGHIAYLLGSSAATVSITIAYHKMDDDDLTTVGELFTTAQQAAFNPGKFGYGTPDEAWTAAWQQTHQYPGFPAAPTPSVAVSHADGYLLMVERLANSGSTEPDPALIIHAREVAKSAFTRGWDDEIQSQFIALYARHQAVLAQEQAAV